MKLLLCTIYLTASTHATWTNSSAETNTRRVGQLLGWYFLVAKEIYADILLL